MHCYIYKHLLSPDTGLIWDKCLKRSAKFKPFDGAGIEIACALLISKQLVLEISYKK